MHSTRRIGRQTRVRIVRNLRIGLALARLGKRCTIIDTAPPYLANARRMRQTANTMNVDKTPLARAVILSTAAWLAHVVAITCVVAVMTLAVSRCVESYEQQDIDLPNMTIMVIGWSDLFISYWYLVVLPLAADAIVLVVLNRAPANLQWLASAWSAAILLAACIFLAITAIALSLPFGDRGPVQLQ